MALAIVYIVPETGTQEQVSLERTLCAQVEVLSKASETCDRVLNRRALLGHRCTMCAHLIGPARKIKRLLDLRV